MLPALIDFAHATVQPPGLHYPLLVTPDARLSLPWTTSTDCIPTYRQSVLTYPSTFIYYRDQHAIMATVMAPEMATQSASLRAELKEWERAFADANGGRKAERSDIKKVPEIGMNITLHPAFSIHHPTHNRTI